MDVEIRPCLEEDLPELFDLFREAYRYNPNMVNKNYFDWLYKGTPFSEREGYEFYLLLESGSIKAIAGCLPVEYRLDGKVERGSWVWNWHAFAQGFYGLYLWEHLKEQYGTVFVSGITEKALQIYKLKEVPVIERTPRWIGILDRNLCRSVLGGTEEFWQQFTQVSFLPGKEVFFADRFDDHEEFFLEELLNVRGYCRRTGKFLNWRFKDIPNHNYQLIRSHNGQYGVFRIEKIKGFDQAVTRIIEWTFDGRLSKEALGLICETSRLEKSIMIDFFSTALQPGRFLEQCGFLAEKDVGFSVPRLFRPLKLSSGISFGIDRSLGSPSNRMFADWYITNADNDSERIKL
jgi:hypothetical protein